MIDNSFFDGLVAVVQYARKDQGDWNNMAAFDNREAAEKYAESCSSDTCPWEYRVVPKGEDNVTD